MMVVGTEGYEIDLYLSYFLFIWNELQYNDPIYGMIQYTD